MQNSAARRPRCSIAWNPVAVRGIAVRPSTSDPAALCGRTGRDGAPRAARRRVRRPRRRGRDRRSRAQDAGGLHQGARRRRADLRAARSRHAAGRRGGHRSALRRTAQPRPHPARLAAGTRRRARTIAATAGTTTTPTSCRASSANRANSAARHHGRNVDDREANEEQQKDDFDRAEVHVGSVRQRRRMCEPERPSAMRAMRFAHAESRWHVSRSAVAGSGRKPSVGGPSSSP